MDFVADQLDDGRRLRMLTVVDDFDQSCIGLVAEFSLGGPRVARELDRMIAERGKPAMIVSDNGTEFTSNAMLRWSSAARIAWHFIAPGKPTRNAFIESFNGKLCGECLNENVFLTLHEVRTIVEAWRIDCNTVRPHRRLGNLPPAVYGATRSSAPEMHGGGARSPWSSAAPRPYAPQSERSKPERTQP
jgi:putative transposase